MLERVIDDWLTNSTERDFEVPFRQLLIHEGRRVLYTSSHGQFELGKDIYALDESGDVLEGYQLKTGPITQATWDGEVRDEVIRLVEVPVAHPGVGVRPCGRTFLVTNGRINDTVLQEIRLRNVEWQRRCHAQLVPIAGQELLHMFLKAQTTVLPTSPTKLRDFLQFVVSDGRKNLDKAAFAEFLKDLLNIDGGGVTEAEARRKVTGLMLFATYALQSYVGKGNHNAVFEGWTLAASSILWYAARCKLRAPVWTASFNLAADAALSALVRLRDEALQRETLTEGDPSCEGEEFYEMRTTLTCGRLSELLLAETLLSGTPAWAADYTRFVARHQAAIKLHGEVESPEILATSLSFHLLGCDKGSFALLSSLLNVLCQQNQPRSERGMPNPYWDLDKIWRLHHGGIGLSPHERRESFVGNSSSLRCIVLTMAYFGLREVLEDQWRAISHVSFAEMVPDEEWESFGWHCSHGENRSRFPKQTQSWDALIDEAGKDEEPMPRVLEDRMWFVPLFLGVFPHRLRWGLYSHLIHGLFPMSKRQTPDCSTGAPPSK